MKVRGGLVMLHRIVLVAYWAAWAAGSRVGNLPRVAAGLGDAIQEQLGIVQGIVPHGADLPPVVA